MLERSFLLGLVAAAVDVTGAARPARAARAARTARTARASGPAVLQSFGLFGFEKVAEGLVRVGRNFFELGIRFVRQKWIGHLNRKKWTLLDLRKGSVISKESCFWSQSKIIKLFLVLPKNGR